MPLQIIFRPKVCWKYYNDNDGVIVLDISMTDPTVQERHDVDLCNIDYVRIVRKRLSLFLKEGLSLFHIPTETDKDNYLDFSGGTYSLLVDCRLVEKIVLLPTNKQLWPEKVISFTSKE